MELHGKRVREANPFLTESVLSDKHGTLTESLMKINANKK